MLSWFNLIYFPILNIDMQKQFPNLMFLAISLILFCGAISTPQQQQTLNMQMLCKRSIQEMFVIYRYMKNVAVITSERQMISLHDDGFDWNMFISLSLRLSLISFWLLFTLIEFHLPKKSYCSRNFEEMPRALRSLNISMFETKRNLKPPNLEDSKQRSKNPSK